MTSSLGLTVVLYAVVVGAVCLVTALRGGTRPPALDAALVVLSLAAAVLGVVDAMTLLGGTGDTDVATNLAYAVTTAVVLPVVAGATRLEPGRWGTACLAVGCLLLAVLCLRLNQTRG